MIGPLNFGTSLDKTKLNRHKKLKLSYSKKKCVLSLTRTFEFIQCSPQFLSNFSNYSNKFSFAHTNTHTVTLYSPKFFSRWTFSSIFIFYFPTNFVPLTQYTQSKRMKVLLWSWQLCAPKFRNSSEYVGQMFADDDVNDYPSIQFRSSYRWLIRIFVDLFHYRFIYTCKYLFYKLVAINLLS